VISGIAKITHFENTAAYMASVGLPLAKVLLILTIVIEVGGGIALILGWCVCWAAAALFVFTFLAAMVFHQFWSADPANVTAQMVNFMKNLSIMGGMLYVMAYGAGPFRLGCRKGNDSTGGKTAAH
jgi:putative oxidoreductase